MTDPQEKALEEVSRILMHMECGFMLILVYEEDLLMRTNVKKENRIELLTASLEQVNSEVSEIVEFPDDN